MNIKNSNGVDSSRFRLRANSPATIGCYKVIRYLLNRVSYMADRKKDKQITAEPSPKNSPNGLLMAIVIK